MTVSVQTVLNDRIAQYISRITAQRHTTEAAAVQALIEAGYEETVRQLHARYQHGELTFRAVAADLGLSIRELYDLCEQKGLPTWKNNQVDLHDGRNLTETVDHECGGPQRPPIRQEFEVKFRSDTQV